MTGGAQTLRPSPVTDETFDAIADAMARASIFSESAARFTSLCNIAGHPAPIAAEAVRDWRTWIADGRASRCSDTLILRAPVLTAAEWSAVHEPRSGSLQ